MPFEWLGQRGQKEPAPPNLQTQYVLAGRKDETQRQRTILISATAVAVVTMTLTALAWWQGRVATSRELASGALIQLDSDPAEFS